MGKTIAKVNLVVLLGVTMTIEVDASCLILWQWMKKAI